MSVYRQVPKAWRFHDLMPYRVREVLLVSSPYDAFILEQDGQLSELVFFEYRDISQQASPRFTHAASCEEALALLGERHFDLVMTMSHPADGDTNAFGRQVKALRRGRPVVLLALDRRELAELRSQLDPEAIDGAFLWTGDSTILLAIIKYVEDRQNVEHDVRQGDVRVIIVTEDSASHYSAFLGLLYKDLMRQSHALQAEGANDLLRQLQMRSRPKVLLATTYEESLTLFERYRPHTMAIICDVRIPRGGVLDPTAGLDLVRIARREDPDLPVLLQSAEDSNRELAEHEGVVFVDKRSPQLLAEIHDFLYVHLGFGDFVFREQPGGPEIARARDLAELEAALATVSERSLVYHAQHNHFSIWLLARSELELAEHLRPRKVSDFKNPDALRRYLIGVLRQTHRETHRGVVSDFSRSNFEHDAFSRIGQGSLGGKARGLAFFNMLLARSDLGETAALPVSVPKTVVIAADQLDLFLDTNGLRSFAYTTDDDDVAIARRFLAYPLPDAVEAELDFLVAKLDCPLAVRSSSLLEDSMHQPFAGIYATLMLPNSAPSAEERRRQLGDAIRLVYASTFSRNAKSYLANTGYRIEEEKMAVIIQPVVGNRHGDRFYPSFSGVAQSYNYYPIAPQHPEDGTVLVALGLGRIVVDGGQALRFSPKHPEVLPQFAKTKSLLDHSQRVFYALDMSQDAGEPGADLSRSVRAYDLEVAEADGTLWPVGSVFSAEERQIRDDLSLTGPRIVTFNNLLKHRAIPLAQTVVRLLEIARQGLGCAVELELACELGDWGNPRVPGRPRREPELFLLQVRPIAVPGSTSIKVATHFERADTLCACTRSLGYGVDETICDVVFVRRETWNPAHHKLIAAEVGRLNATLGVEGRRYLLIGPGRWGTADPWLGIPVEWAQISNVHAIVEASPKGYDVEPSQGTHFFQNITALGVGYFSLPAGADKTNPEQDDYLDWAWLEAQPPLRETAHLRHVRLERPLALRLDGRTGRGTIVRAAID
ncbi:MAG: hypothetical protein HC897_11650 [Thermoanaerobaculia bacterium]|nr:hypothetical protein [Thermoanaerobaculia bacterium]